MAASSTIWTNGDDSVLPIGVTPRDLQCPICCETVQDAFVTPCGHTFCHGCLATHMRTRKSCPSCGTYITQDHVYPNFLLNKARTHAAAPCETHASHASVRALTRTPRAPHPTRATDPPERVCRRGHLQAHYNARRLGDAAAVWRREPAAAA
jgi:hypothetical protein